MKKLRLYFGFLFLVLGLLVGFFLFHVQRNLERDSFLAYQKSVQHFFSELQWKTQEILGREEKRSFFDYQFFLPSNGVKPSQDKEFLSPLSEFPPKPEVPGIIGYFQIDPDRTFHVPFFPDQNPDFIKNPSEKVERLKARKVLFDMVTQAFESLETNDEKPREKKINEWVNLHWIEKFSPQSLSQPYPSTSSKNVLPKETKNPDSALRDFEKSRRFNPPKTDSYVLGPGGIYEKPETEKELLVQRQGQKIHKAQWLELEPFQAKILENQWMVFFRNAWWNEQRFIQGFMVEISEFFDGTIPQSASASSVFPQGKVFILFKGEILHTTGTKGEYPLKPFLVDSMVPSSPLTNFTFLFVSSSIPKTYGLSVLHFLTLLLGLLLTGGLYSFYRFASAQLELSRQKSDFVASVSHELRTPLTSIRMYSEILSEEWEKNSQKRKEYLRSIQSESERLTRLIENVLQLSNLEKGRPDWKVISQSPEPLIEKIRSHLEEITRKAGFSLEIQKEGVLRNILVHPDALFQVLRNVVENSVKFSKNSDPKKIILRLFQTADFCVIQVRDFGPGIPKEKISKIFDPFYRANHSTTPETSGSGLGLTLTKRFMDQMNAKIQVVNQNPGVEISLFFDAVD